jgi:hypothetical protein
MASYMARAMSNSAAAAPPVSLDTINPKVRHLTYPFSASLIRGQSSNPALG